MRVAGLTKKLAAGVALAALMLGTTAGPSWAADTLRFLSWQVEDPAFGPWWRTVIDEFERTHEGVEIEFTNVPRDSFADQMTTQFASGSPPEIVHLASFEFQSFADNGWLEPLAPWIERSDLDLEGWAGQEICQFQGETVCIMVLYYGTIMAYNKGMFEAAGLSVPTTYEEHLAAARELTKDVNNDGFVDQYGIGLSTAGGAGQYLTELLSYVVDAGASWTNEQGEPTLDTPEMIEALGRWKTLVEEKLSPQDLASGDIRQLFIEGRIAMRVDGPWLYGIMQKAKPEIRDQLAIAAPPFQPPTGGSSNVIAMPSEIDEDTKKLVWDFIQIAVSPEFQRSYAEMGAMPAPRPGAIPADIEQTVPHFDLLMRTMNEASAAGIDRIPKGYETQFNEFSKMIQEEVQRMLVSDLAPEEVAARMQERAEGMK
jgi:multiple sugar transport system substrate-binding protein